MDDKKYWKLGIIGWPLGYSLSPVMQTAALEAAGLKGAYRECPVEPNSRGESVDELADISDLKAGIERWLMKGELADGFNVTRPFKSKAYVWVLGNGGQIPDSPGSVAHAMHVINTVKWEGKKPIGFNTDGIGFLLGLGDVNLAGAAVALFGAGGAARTIAATLALQRKVGKITFWNRSRDNAESTKQDLAAALRFNDCKVVLGVSSDLQSFPVGESRLLINATPLGTAGKEEIPHEILERLHSGQMVYDIVYEPKETALIREARKCGCQVITGDEMLAGQGAAAFEIWTGVPATKALPAMRRALDEHFAARS